MCLVSFHHWLSRRCVCMCVFSCSWRFTFYLLAFIAGLAALIDVSTTMLTLTPPLPLVSSCSHDHSSTALPVLHDSFHGSPSFCCDNFSSCTVRGLHLWPCWVSYYKYTCRACCLILMASLLPETLAVWPEGDVARLSCAGTFLGWIHWMYTSVCLQIKGIKWNIK